MRTAGVFYSPTLGGAWHIHNTLMEPGHLQRIIHIFIGDPRPDLLEAVMEHKLDHVRIPYRSRRDLPRAILRARRTLRIYEVDVVHAHGIEGTVTALIAGFLAGVKDRIHTRHHADMHHVGGPRRGVLLDRFVNRSSTAIIATCNNVRNCLIDLEKVDPKKIRVLEYRLNLANFSNTSEERIGVIRSRYDLDPKRRIIGMISRFVWWKGVEYGIEAFSRFLKKEPDAVLVIANAAGPHLAVIRPLLETIPERNYRLIEHEYDIGALYNTFDMLMHLPVTAGVEAWGQVYVESMASGVPVVCTRSGIGNDLLVDGENCVLVDYRNSDQAYEGLVLLSTNTSIRSSIIDKALEASMRYALTPNYNTLEFLYGPGEG